MASHKQKKDKKKYHQRKHRNHGRSSQRKHEGKKKNEGKKENIPCNKIAWDISAYIDNRREMIGQMFSSVGESFFSDKVPQIFQDTSREELKKICLEELTSMSNEMVIKILEGIPIEVEPKEPFKDADERSKNTRKRSNKYSSRESSPSRRQRKIKRREKVGRKGDRSSEDGEINNSCEDDENQSVSAVEPQSDVGQIELTHFKDHITERKEVPSTSFQLTTTKKLAKVAPFIVSVQQPKEQVVPAPVLSEEEGDDDVISYEVVDLGLEDDFEMEDIPEEVETEVLPEVEIIRENSNYPTGKDERMLQPVSEMLELEHRARAIRSMLANIDKL